MLWVSPMMPWTNKQDALGLGDAVADLDCVANGRDGSVGRHVGGAEDRVGKSMPDGLADHFLEEDLDRPGQRPRIGQGRREPVEGDHGLVRGSALHAAERQEELAVESDRDDVLVALASASGTVIRSGASGVTTEGSFTSVNSSTLRPGSEPRLVVNVKGWHTLGSS